MTQEQLAEYLRKYLKEYGNPDPNHLHDLDMVTAMAVAAVEGLVLWLRERNDVFLRND